MKLKEYIKNIDLKKASKIIYILSVINQIACDLGILVPNSSRAVMEEYVNLFGPAHIILLIEYVVLIWLGILLLKPDLFNKPSQSVVFEKGYRSEFIKCLLLGILAQQSLCYKNFLLLSIFCALYFKVCEDLLSKTSKGALYRNSLRPVRDLIGLLFGWRLVMVFISLSYLGVSFGLMRNGFIATLWAAGLLYMTVVMAGYYYIRYNNVFVMYSLIWYIINLLIDRYVWRTMTMFKIALVALAFAVIITIVIYKLHQKEVENSKKIT